jgi:flagellar biosynthesis GTPase FlhF
MIQQQRYNKLRYGFIRIQSLFRGKQSRKDNSNIIQHLKEFVIFYSLWGNCIKLSKSVEMDEPDWSSLREKQAYIRQQELMRDDEEEMKETDEKLTNSMADAMRTMEGKAAKLEDDMEEVYLPMKTVGGTGGANNSNNNTDVLLNFKRIHFSGEVVKWIRNGDRKYVSLFVRRMRQLSGGERSRILAKRLNGSTTNKVPIYETYLEQKSGYRILWTEKDDYLLVWYVANHDKVSRLMRLIDDSKSRSQRQRVSINDMDEMKDACHNAKTKDEDEIFLDPLGNVPLKVYDIGINDIEDIKKRDWTPALHLTEEERTVVETEGTVLLLGRSGTGKTICICNRMEYDRQQFKSDPLFSQLFVARSPRLCTYVKNNIGESDGSEFVTFEMLLEELENTLPKVENIRDSFPENQFMRFSAFKQEIYDGDKGVDALIVWTNIRSFMKGSIEALQDSNLAVSEDEYLSEENFGKKRCRLTTDQRKIVYEIFLKYQERMNETNAWDNCDRIIALIQRLHAAKISDPEMFEGAKIWCRWSKIYVDEVSNVFCFCFCFL